jgi:REP-associated tyrosine transposase
MPWALRRFQQSRQLHFLTFRCYKRQAKFRTPSSRRVFESALELVRQQYQLCVYGYVVMPEPVHLLVNKPERGTLAQALQSLKQGVARRLGLRAEEPSGRRAIMTSTSGANASLSRSCVIFIAIP